MERAKRIQAITRYTYNAKQTITITEEAYDRLRRLKSENQSFSDVILQSFPAKKKLSQILAKIGRDDDPANWIEAASREMRRSKMRNVEV
ncbi:MAG: antitoxin VapB family protein [Methanothrix sp.]